MLYMTFVASCSAAVLMQAIDRRRSRAPIYASTGEQMEEFRQVLPALARSQIQVLLRELRKEHSIHSIGLTKGARWFPGPVPANCNFDEPSS